MCNDRVEERLPWTPAASSLSAPRPGCSLGRTGLSEQLLAVRLYKGEMSKVMNGSQEMKLGVLLIDKDYLEVGLQLLPEYTMLPLQLLERPHAAG